MTDTARGLPRQRSAPACLFGREPRIGILVAYNVAITLAHTVDRIPGSFRKRVSASSFATTRARTKRTGSAWNTSSWPRICR